MHSVLSLIFCFFLSGFAQKVGDRCTDKFTNTVGKCVAANLCLNEDEYERPINFGQTIRQQTFCEDSIYGAVVCCTNNELNKRVSEIKCEEYANLLSKEECKITTDTLIMDEEETQIHEFPHMAAIGWLKEDGSYSYACSGTLISPVWVLTAGFCKRGRLTSALPVFVRLGEGKPLYVPIKSVQAHPLYQPPKIYNNIALIMLEFRVPFTREIHPACLWQSYDTEASHAIATGWLTANNNTSTDNVPKVSLQLLNNTYCDELLIVLRNRNWKGFEPTQLCACEFGKNRGTCQVASGSPLQLISKDSACLYHIIGVTSFGYKCDKIDKPTVFTRVFSYLDWIESVVWPDAV